MGKFLDVSKSPVYNFFEKISENCSQNLDDLIIIGFLSVPGGMASIGMGDQQRYGPKGAKTSLLCYTTLDTIKTAAYIATAYGLTNRIL